jgi:hypothetical protein
MRHPGPFGSWCDGVAGPRRKCRSCLQRTPPPPPSPSLPRTRSTPSPLPIGYASPQRVPIRDVYASTSFTDLHVIGADERLSVAHHSSHRAVTSTSNARSPCASRPGPALAGTSGGACVLLILNHLMHRSLSMGGGTVCFIGIECVRVRGPVRVNGILTEDPPRPH